MPLKQINRKIRVLRLLAVVRAYHCYTMMELYRKSLQHDNSWEDAEHLSDWVNALMPYRESSPTEFLYDRDEMSDTVLNYGSTLQSAFVEYSFFTGKAQPANLTGFKKTILDIERNILEIADKQVNRNFRKKN